MSFWQKNMSLLSYVRSVCKMRLLKGENLFSVGYLLQFANLHILTELDNNSDFIYIMRKRQPNPPSES